MSKKKFTHGMSFSTEGEMYDQLSEEAFRRRVSVSCLIRQALEQMLEKAKLEFAELQAKEMHSETID